METQVCSHPRKRIVVDYDRLRTEGMTEADMVEAFLLGAEKSRLSPFFRDRLARRLGIAGGGGSNRGGERQEDERDQAAKQKGHAIRR